MEEKVESENPFIGVKGLSNEDRELLLSLPRKKLWGDRYLCKYQNFWCPSWYFHGFLSFQRHFQAHDSDILIITFPKSGTTWLKALTFSIANRSRFAIEESPLLTTFTHDLVRFLELDLYAKSEPPNLDDLPKPRIFSTHAPFGSLPDSVVNSKCRIVYIWRNPSDQFISEWQFLVGLQGQTTMDSRSMEEAFELACHGVQCYGPGWDHILSYWKASLEDPQKFIFLKYEDMKDDKDFYVRKLAEFLGYPFTKDEESQGLIEKITKLCSFENLKNLDANTGKHPQGPEKSLFFRKGKVGDSKNYLTPSMSERLEKIVEEKLRESGFPGDE